MDLTEEKGVEISKGGRPHDERAPLLTIPGLALEFVSNSHSLESPFLLRDQQSWDQLVLEYCALMRGHVTNK